MNHISRQPTDTHMKFIRQKFLDAMSCVASSVNVITTDGPAGSGGVTVTAMSSVSADTAQPTLMVCVHKLSNAAEKIRDNGVFCVNVLQDTQMDISNSFAGRSDSERFSLGEWLTMNSGVPGLAGSLAAFDCRLIQSQLMGTHYVLFGEVEDIFISESGSPLIYANRNYMQLKQGKL